MASFKLQRATEDLKRELAAVIRELKDSRITSMLSVIKVDLSKDMSYAKVYVSDLNGADASALAVKGLENAKGYIKREISNKLGLRKAPELKFIIDDSLEYSANINRILEDINRG